MGCLDGGVSFILEDIIKSGSEKSETEGHAFLSVVATTRLAVSICSDPRLFVLHTHFCAWQDLIRSRSGYHTSIAHALTLLFQTETPCVPQPNNPLRLCKQLLVVQLVARARSPTFRLQAQLALLHLEVCACFTPPIIPSSL